MTDLEREQRQRVAALARQWIGTPYRHNARLKGIGADCTFVAEVYAAVGLIPPVDIAHYSPQFHLHRNEELYLNAVLEHATEAQAAQVGDLALYRVGRVWSHSAIIVDPGWPHIVHADAGAAAIVPANGEGGRIGDVPRKFFTLWT